MEFFCVFGPFLVASIIVQFIGIIVMIYAVVDIINGISVGQAMPSEKNAKTKDKDDIPDALVEEIKPKKKKKERKQKMTKSKFSNEEKERRYKIRKVLRVLIMVAATATIVLAKFFA